MEIKEACKKMGASKCEFPPDEMECETCEKPNLQLYYIRTCYESDEGEYHCADCMKEMPERLEKDADKFMKHLEEQDSEPVIIQTTSTVTGFY